MPIHLLVRPGNLPHHEIVGSNYHIDVDGGPEPVYNLEVQFEHVYRVGDPEGAARGLTAVS